jgi:hypothetical protein
VPPSIGEGRRVLLSSAPGHTDASPGTVDASVWLV